MDKMKVYCAEFIGTLLLVFLACGSAVFVGCDVGGGHLAVALAFGLAVVAMAYTIGSVSGCHINPAISLGMLISGRLSIVNFIGYLVSQIAGAIGGAGLLYLMVYFSDIDETGVLAANSIENAGGIAGALIIEVILTFVFVSVVLAVTDAKGTSAVSGLVIGLTLTVVHIIGIPLTGTSVNPARSIGPAIFAGGDALAELWVFIAAPLAGAVLAALFYKLLIQKAKA